MRLLAQLSLFIPFHGFKVYVSGPPRAETGLFEIADDEGASLKCLRCVDRRRVADPSPQIIGEIPGRLGLLMPRL